MSEVKDKYYNLMLQSRPINHNDTECIMNYVDELEKQNEKLIKLLLKILNHKELSSVNDIVQSIVKITGKSIDQILKEYE